MRKKCVEIHLFYDAEELLQLLLRFSKKDRMSINFNDDINRLEVWRQTLTDGSEVTDLGFKASTKDQMRRERE